MNNILDFYETKEQWNSVSSRFLEGSNQIAERPIANINYSTSENRNPDQGYYGALINSVNAGVTKTPLNTETVIGWKMLILKEMLKNSTISDEDYNRGINEKEIPSFIEKFQTNLTVLNNKPTENNIVSFLSEVCCEIESDKLFDPINRRISHLFLCYLVSYFKSPLIVFEKKDRDAYLSSISNNLKMKIFLADKICETVLDQGLLLHRVGGKDGNEWYKSEESTSKKDLTIEWHELFEAVKQWKEQLDKESSHL